ncbi:hypothetical protein ACMGDM_19030 [Sphingomonas sp. DT-51]|uniref:hypothetical protein n=1 Tax=Sphingomonas sp. DT-51 TaxID=3396165 RepID=UPI003F1BEFF5
MLVEAAAAANAAAPAARVTDLGPIGGTAPDAAGAARFQSALERAGPAGAAPPAGAVADLPPTVTGLFQSLDAINGQARSVAEYAATAQANGTQLTPGELVQLTMRCQQFMFECQLTSNIANRSSDGVQQLFKQQG